MGCTKSKVSTLKAHPTQPKLSSNRSSQPPPPYQVDYGVPQSLFERKRESIIRNGERLLKEETSDIKGKTSIRKKHDDEIREQIDNSLIVKPHVQMFLSEKKQTIPLLFEFETGDFENLKKRPAFDLCIVLDTSSSMQDEARLEQAVLAITELIDRLQPQDRIHLITYSTSAIVIFENGSTKNKRTLKSKLESVRSGGGTDICEGLCLGVEAIANSFQPNRARHLVLFSDGEVNHGIEDPEEIFQLVETMQSYDIFISSVGIGANFNEVLMRGISKSGYGNYVYIQGAHSISEKVNMLYNGLSGRIAQNIIFSVQWNDNVDIIETYGHPKLAEGQSDNIGSMSRCDKKRISYSLRVYPPSDSGASVSSLGTWTVDYFDMESGGSPVRLQGKIEISGFDNSKAKEEKIPDKVLIYSTVAETNTKNKQIVSILQDNHPFTSEAKDSAIALKKQVIASLESVVALDDSGDVQWMLDRAKGNLGDIMNCQDKGQVYKELDYQMGLACNLQSAALM